MRRARFRMTASPAKGGRAFRNFIHLCLFTLAALFLVESAISWQAQRREALAAASADRVQTARMAAVVMAERMTKVADTAVSLATRPSVRVGAANGQWDEALLSVSDVPAVLPYVERIMLYDKNGVLRALYPELPNIVGTDFSYREYFSAVRDTGKPYVSDVFVAATQAPFIVVAATAPITSPADGSFDGVLLLQFRLSRMLDWTQSVSFGQGTEAYFVDRVGHALGNRFHASPDSLYDASARPEVAAVLHGETGSFVGPNPDTGVERIVSYAPLPGSGWGVILEQPTDRAFAGARTSAIRGGVIGGLFMALFFALGVVLLKVFRDLYLVRERQRLIIDSAGDCLVAIDKEWNITLWNPEASRVSGWSAAEALGQPLRKMLRFVKHVDRSENVLFIADAMSTKQVQFMGEDTVLVRKDGTDIDVSDSAAPILDEDGEVRGAVVVFRDVSREREIERSKNDLVSMVTHELRTPATVIRGYLELLTEQWGMSMEEAQREYLKKISLANDKMLELANSLLAAFRVDYGEVIVSPQPVDLCEQAAAAVKQYAAAAKDRRISLVANCEEGLPYVNADMQLVGLTFANLISNALKYTPEGGHVTVTVRKEGREARIEVTDDGLGIPEAQQAKMFTKFFRGSNVRALQGVGLGLHVLKAMLERAGCEIAFTSEEGKGTTFTVTVPVEGMRKIGKT